MKALAALASVLLIAGCGNSVDRGDCLNGHREPYVFFILSGNVMIPITQSRFVCDEWEFPDGKPHDAKSKEAT